MNTYLSKISFLTILLNTTSFGMITALRLHSQRWQQQNLLKKRPFFFPTSLNTDKPLLLLKNEPESQEELLCDNMLSSDLKNIIMSNLDFASERAYWCTNKNNNTLGHFNWRQRNNLNSILPENFNLNTSRRLYFYYQEPGSRYINSSEHDSLTAAVVTRSHERLKKILKKREHCFADAEDMDFLFKESIRIAEIFAMHRVGDSRIQFGESEDLSVIGIRERNMAAMELLLEHQCNLHNISKESFKKFYNIPGYQKYLDSRVKIFLREIEKSIQSSDVQYFKLLVKCIHPDIINHPIQRDEQEASIRRVQYLQKVFTVLDYVYVKCHWHLHHCQLKETNRLNWSLINFLRKYGALTYRNLIASPSQTHPYGFKLPQDYHETGFIINDPQNKMYYWVNPELLNSTLPVNNSPIAT